MSGEFDILIIEDDVVDQMAFSRMMQKHLPKAKIKLAENIEEGKLKIETQDFEWVISDFNLPDGTVMDIAPYAKSCNMICVSGETAASQIQFLKDLGWKGFFIKDQHLNYLNKIIELIQSSQAEHSIIFRKQKNDDYLAGLLSKFDGDKKIVEDIFKLFKNNGMTDVNLLKQLGKDRNANQVNSIAHRMTSTYRVLKKDEAVIILENVEDESIKNNPDWQLLETLIIQVENICQALLETISLYFKAMNEND